MPKKIVADLRLTATELEFMNILWDLKEGSVNDVRSKLPESRNLAYTSVATILRLLEQKKFLKSRKEGREHVFTPLVLRATYEGSALSHVVKSVFNNAPSALVMRLVSDVPMSRDEIEAIKKLVDERMKS